ncbi:hypothetical protein, partial [Chromobacterium subtsugae]|uniref:hypothetical protein n=1 Tax=Chromobacterium subtsugae TaxID=251747 RepID=UPI001C0FB2DB
ATCNQGVASSIPAAGTKIHSQKLLGILKKPQTLDLRAFSFPEPSAAISWIPAQKRGMFRGMIQFDY